MSNETKLMESLNLGLLTNTTPTCISSGNTGSKSFTMQKKQKEMPNNRIELLTFAYHIQENQY